MTPMLSVVAVLAAAGFVISGCGTSSSQPAEPSQQPTERAVVLVSGLATQTPFTTTTQGCSQGSSAGDSVSVLRDALIADGHQVYTAPAQIGPTQVTTALDPGGFSQCPAALPAAMTIDTTKPIDAGGRRLLGFLLYLHDTYGLQSVDLVGHSMGGLFSRSAIKVIQDQSLPIKVRSLTTLGTPWTGTYPADYSNGSLPLSVCKGDPTCTSVLPGYQRLSQEEGPQGAAADIATNRLQGPTGWNASQGSALAGIPVTLIAGNYFTHPGGAPRVWPNDGIVGWRSAIARRLSNAILPHRSCLTRPDIHTVALAEAAKQSLSAVITQDPVVLAAVNDAINQADVALSKPDRQGC